jgi:tRNA modification GTPase
MADADLVLVVIDAHAESGCDPDEQLIAAAAERSAILVENKIDLGRHSAANGWRLPVAHTSATTGEGIAELREQILRMVSGDSRREESGFLTNLRQHQLVTDALAGLAAAEEAIRLSIPHEMVLMDLHNALRPLDDITGATTADDILNLIFSTFCIGK